MEPEPTAPVSPAADRIVLKLQADSTDEELEVTAEALADWIESIDPDFFLPEND
jgi:hypothetical protein